MDTGGNWPVTVLRTRLMVLGLVILGIGLLIAARRLFKKKQYFIICRAGNRVIKYQAKDNIQQDIILATINAIKGKQSKIG